jgi:stearoyl-CoA desaturase (Delta-9 desaturase)
MATSSTTLGSFTYKPTLWQSLLGLFDSDFFPQGALMIRSQAPAFNWGRLLPFVFLHAGCLGIIWVGASSTAVWATVILYFARMFMITAFYHRYFSHRTFSTSRWFQALAAFLGGMSVQRGALWWAANHRHHHRHSDEPTDLHSPKQDGFWWSQIGWMTSHHSIPTDYRLIPDLSKFPELVWLNRLDWIPPLVLLIGVGLLGLVLPGTNPLQMIVWGFFVSTVILFHCTGTINSLSHVWGTRRYETKDTSRNNLILALLTLGEGWHNNHHAYPGTAHQGFFWWELDVSYYILRALSAVGLVWDLRPVPASAYTRAKPPEPA